MGRGGTWVFQVQLEIACTLRFSRSSKQRLEASCTLLGSTGYGSHCRVAVTGRDDLQHVVYSILSVIRYGGTGTVTAAIHAAGLNVTCKEVSPKTNRNDRPQPTFLSSSLSPPDFVSPSHLSVYRLAVVDPFLCLRCLFPLTHSLCHPLSL